MSAIVYPQTPPVQPYSEIPFRLECPAETFEKAGESGQSRRIGGIISSEHRDRQGEIVLQDGLEFDDFLSNGWFNDNHSQDTAKILGYPLQVQPTMHKGKPATRVEGYLLEDYEPADSVWKLSRALQKTGRKLGFSVEGKIGRRVGPDGKIIAKARVTNVAVTNCPVNTTTGLEVLTKSLHAAEMHPLAPWEKALTAGSAISAPPAVPGEGFPLRAESLEGEPPHRVGKRKALRIIRERFPQLNAKQAERIWEWVSQRSQA